MKTAREWKDYYARERTRLGEAGLLELLERSPVVDLPPGGALVFPHTRLRESGHLTAAVARAVARSGCTEVLALGVLHSARAADAELVRQARSGDPDGVHSLRRVHGPGMPDDADHWTEEFSLDGFVALLAAACRVEDCAVPRVHCRYPFLVGETSADLPGMEGLRALLARGAVLVGTTDPIHHGRGYGDPAESCRAAETSETTLWARAIVEEASAALCRQDYATFQRLTAAHRSDFRDVGLVLVHLLAARGPLLRSMLHDLVLVDYADELDAEHPTWVGAGLSSFDVSG